MGCVLQTAKGNPSDCLPRRCTGCVIVHNAWEMVLLFSFPYKPKEAVTNSMHSFKPTSHPDLPLWDLQAYHFLVCSREGKASPCPYFLLPQPSFFLSIWY